MTSIYRDPIITPAITIINAPPLLGNPKNSWLGGWAPSRLGSVGKIHPPFKSHKNIGHLRKGNPITLLFFRGRKTHHHVTNVLGWCFSKSGAGHRTWGKCVNSLHLGSSSQVDLSRWWVLNIFYVHSEPWGRWTHFDSYFSDGLKPPTSCNSIQIPPEFVSKKCL